MPIELESIAGTGSVARVGECLSALLQASSVPQRSTEHLDSHHENRIALVLDWIGNGSANCDQTVELDMRSIGKSDCGNRIALRESPRSNGFTAGASRCRIDKVRNPRQALATIATTVQAFLKGSSPIPESRRNEGFRDTAEAVTRVT